MGKGIYEEDIMNYKFAKLKKMKSYELSYMAGLIDGEGMIAFKHAKKSLKGKIKFLPIITIMYSTDLEHTKKVSNITGAPYYYQTSKDSQTKLVTNRMKQTYRVGFIGYKNCLELLNKVTKYLILKKQHAILMKKIIKMHKYSKDIRKKEAKLILKVYRLNSSIGRKETIGIKRLNQIINGELKNLEYLPDKCV